MSETIDHNSFYIADAGDGAIGFDGMGAIDFERSDLLLERSANPMRVGRASNDANLDPKATSPVIVLRRAVREFDLLHDINTNSLLVRSGILDTEGVGGAIQNSATELFEVNCTFGAKSRSYFFGKLKHDHCINQIDFSASSFMIIGSTDFEIHRTSVGRGERPLSSEAPVIERNLTFANYKEMMTYRKWFDLKIPEHLSFGFSPAAVINLGNRMTLIRKDIFEKLWFGSRPKSRVLGMKASSPLVSVTFRA